MLFVKKASITTILLLGISLTASQNDLTISNIVTTVVNVTDQLMQDGVSSSSSDEDLSDSMVQYCPVHTRSSFSIVRPYIQSLMRKPSATSSQDPTHNENSPVELLQRVRSGEIPSPDQRFQLQALLVEAAMKAVEDKEEKIKAQEQLLELREQKLKDKLSKKNTAALTLGATLVSNIITGITVAYTKGS